METPHYKTLITNDERANFVCGTKGFDEDLKRETQEYTMLDRVDYGIALEPEPELAEQQTDARKNISYMNVKNVEEGVEWYRKNDPRIPEELLGFMSRWSFGDLSTITKKQVRNERKKAAKRVKKKSMKCDIKYNKSPQIVVFD